MPKDNPLAELAAIAQLYRAVSPEPGVAQHQAIQLFGLMQQQQEAQQRQQMAMQQLAQQRIQQQAELGLQQRTTDMNDWQVTDESNRAYNEQAGREAVLKQQAAMQLLQNFAGMPGTTGQDVLGLAEKQGVTGADAMLQAITQSANRKATQEVMPGIQAAYGQFSTDPTKAKSALDMLMQDSRMTPEVNSMIPWDQLNAGVPTRPASTFMPSSATGAGEMINRAGGSLGTQIMNVPAAVYNTGSGISDMLAAAMGLDWRAARMRGPGDMWKEYKQTGQLPASPWVPQQ